MGISGEDDIGDELKKLPNDFVVIHQGLDTNKGNIDKIVVGPTGVFTIEVKSHKARVTFNGEELLNYFRPFEKDFLKQAYAEAIFLREHLKNNLNLEIEVQPVLVFSSQKAMMRFGFQKIKGAYVIQKRWLNKLITQPNSNFLSEEVKGKIVSLLQA